LFDSELSKSNHNQSRHTPKKSLDSDPTISNHGPKNRSIRGISKYQGRNEQLRRRPEAQSAWKKMKAVVYAVAIVNELKKQAGYHELNIGHVGRKLKAMILTGQTKYRAPPSKLLQEYKPVCAEAAQVGALVKLDENVVEASGRRSHLGWGAEGKNVSSL
jgi:hypothetical protein